MFSTFLSRFFSDYFGFLSQSKKMVIGFGENCVGLTLGVSGRVNGPCNGLVNGLGCISCLSLTVCELGTVLRYKVGRIVKIEIKILD